MSYAEFFIKYNGTLWNMIEPLNQSCPKTIQTAMGEVRIFSFATPAALRRLFFSNGFGEYAKYRSIYTQRESLENFAARPDVNVAIACLKDEILGFGLLVPPEKEERWSSVGNKTMIEVKALEVARQMRSAALAPAILENLLTDPELDEKIVYLVSYSWTWDLDGTSKSVPQYRNKLLALFSRFNFTEYLTNEPNICLKPENIFMARVGKNVSRDIQEAFKWACFGLTP